MNALPRPRSSAIAVVAAAWAGMILCILLDLIFDELLVREGRNDLSQFPEDGLLFALPILSCAVVGSALAIRRPGHPVGWFLLALGAVINVSGVFDGYAAYGAVARPGSLPAADFVATVADAAFIPWLMLLAGVVLFTPTGSLSGRPARLLAYAVLIGGALSFILVLLRPYQGDHIAEGTVENPLAIESLSQPIEIGTTAALILLHVGLLGAVGLLALRFRASKGAEKRQLRWVTAAAIPFPVLVVGAFIAATVGNETALGLMASGFVAVVPLAVGLAVEQDHLYDLDSLLSRGLTYSLLSVLLVGCYALTVLFVSQALGDFGGDSQLPSIAATLATVSFALPARRYLQESLDRRFNRRQFNALATVRRFVEAPVSSTTVEQVLREALDDDGLTIAYWIEERELWVDEMGRTALPGASAILANRRGSTIAAVDSPKSGSDRRMFASAIEAAMPEIENARLRAAIALQLVEVRDSRARIVAAQMEERRRIERNLHDGAQQRLLALALRLTAAEVSADPARLRAALAAGVEEAQAAVRELRELANGLRPSILNDGGLAAALDELAARSPLPIEIEATEDRYSPGVEEAAWYIACEAVANAVKHAGAHKVWISCSRTDGHLRLSVADDGIGGADPGGSGLRGISDRAEAMGGRILLDPGPQGGTLVRAELPCGS